VGTPLGVSQRRESVSDESGCGRTAETITNVPVRPGYMPIGLEPRVSIVILNWNGWEDTIECLDSVLGSTYGTIDVVLVDNGSTDGSVERIREFCQGLIVPRSNFGKAGTYLKPVAVREYWTKDFREGSFKDCPPGKPAPGTEVVILRNEINTGFAEGCNIGMKYALSSLNPDYLMLLNNDTYVLPDCLAKLVLTAERFPEIVMLGPKICYYDNPRVVWATGGRIRLFTGQIGNDGRGHLSRQYEELQHTDYVTGCAVMISRDALNEIGSLNTRYFLYFEDADWGLRARSLGHPSAIDATAVILHKSARSVRRGDLGYYYFTRNLLLFMSKNARWYHLPSFAAVFIVRYATMFFFNLVTARFQRCRNISEAVTDFVRGVSGKNPRTSSYQP
jgi:GT2 family glycosyltransferase